MSIRLHLTAMWQVIHLAGQQGRDELRRRLHLTALWQMIHRRFVRVALALMAAGSITSALAQDRFDVWTTENGLPQNSINAILQTRDGYLWLATHDGLVRYDGTHFVIFDKQNTSSIVSNRFTTLFEDRHGSLWAGTEDGSLIEHRNGVFKLYAARDEWPDFSIARLDEDESGRLLITSDRTIFRLEDGRFNPLLKLDATSDWQFSNLWWCKDETALQFIVRGRLNRYAKADGLPSLNIRAVIEDQYANLWIDTEDAGLIKLAGKEFIACNTTIASTRARFLAHEDARGNLWMSCNKGIYRASRQELNEFAAGRMRAITCVAYDTKDGMLIAECNGGRQPAGWKMSDGKLWFPTMGGVAVIDPAALRINLAPPPVMIDEFRLDNQPLAWGDVVSIPPGGDHFEIGYKGVSFIKPESMRFKYRLDGFDQDWIDAGTRRTAYYGHVPYGEYTFTVLAANSDGIWNQTGASLRITVRPHWHQIRWVQALMVVAAMLGAMAALMVWNRRRTVQMQKEMAMQREFSRKLITVLDRHRQRISERLHNELKQYLYFIRLSAHAAQADLDQLPGDEAERVQAIAENLEEITETATKADSETRAMIDDLHPYQLKELGLSRAIAYWLEQIGKASAIRFACQIDALDGIFDQEAEVSVYSIVQEAINNVVKHAQATAATLTISRGPRAIAIVVADNGKGFATAEAQAGFGLQMIAERAGMIGGVTVISSTPGQGTTVTIKISIERKTDEERDQHRDG